MKLSSALIKIAGLLLIGSFLLSGCASPPPCEVTEAQVDEARAAAAVAAEAHAEMAEAELKTLETELETLRGQYRSEEELTSLKAHLAELECGSGR